MQLIPEDELSAMSALCHAAMLYERLLAACFERRPELVEEIAKPHLALIDLAGRTVQHWRNYLEITDDLSAP